MISEKSFLKLVDLTRKVRSKVEKVEKGLNSIFDDDTSVFLSWPIDYSYEMLETVIVDCGETKEGAEWFVWEGLPQIEKGFETAIGDDIDGKRFYYRIKSVKDYYNYITKNYKNLDKVEEHSSVYVKSMNGDIMSLGDILKNSNLGFGEL